ncbi:PD-(D/E)XK nuclease family protein [Thermosulfuriphilus sp.]
MKLRLLLRQSPLEILNEDKSRIRWGELAHLALYFLVHFRGHLAEIHQAVARALAYFPGGLAEDREQVAKDLKKILLKALSHYQVRRFFDPRYQAYVEYEIMTFRGNRPEVYRLDRLVFTEEGPVVLEFKLGEKDDRHRHQVRHYRALVSSLWGPAKAYLLYLEGPDLEEVC